MMVDNREIEVAIKWIPSNAMSRTSSSCIGGGIWRLVALAHLISLRPPTQQAKVHVSNVTAVKWTTSA